MSAKPRLPRAFSVLILLAALVLAALPAQAQPARRPVPGLRAVAVLGENALARVQAFLASLWTPGTKEGMSIDPNGSPNHEGMSIDPDGSPNDEGVTIDPNGQH